MFKKIEDWFKKKKDQLFVDETDEKAAEAKRQEEEKVAEAKRQEEEKAAEVKRQEEEREAEAKRQEEERAAEAKRQEEERVAEAKRQEEEKAAEVKRQEEEREAEAKRQEEERAAEAKRQEEERAAEAKRQEEERAAEARRQEEEKVAEAKRQEEERVAEAKRQEEEKEAEAKRQEEEREAEARRQEEEKAAEAKRQEEEKAAETKKPKKKGFFEKLVDGLDKTRKDMTDKINSVFSSYHKVDEELFEDLEEILVTADVGINTTMSIIDSLRDRVKQDRVTEPEEVKVLLKEEIKKVMITSEVDTSLNIEPSPAIILVVGVNGVGKTTTIGKLSNNLKKDGKKVLVAAGDTFRAAAIEQLEEWGSRANVDIISHTEGADPAAVIYDGIQAAKARKTDVLICDTAGRLHNKKNLMNELNKIFRVVENEYPEAKKEVLLVLDATTGQNAILQAKTFKEVSNITGIALTKLDGTAKGGVVIALQAELGIPVKLIGVGEQIDDLQRFDSTDFVNALFE